MFLGGTWERVGSPRKSIIPQPRVSTARQSGCPHLASRANSRWAGQAGTLYTKANDRIGISRPRCDGSRLGRRTRGHWVPRGREGLQDSRYMLLSAKSNLKMPCFVSSVHLDGRIHAPNCLQTLPRSSYDVPLATERRYQNSENRAVTGPGMCRSRYHAKNRVPIRYVSDTSRIMRRSMFAYVGFCLDDVFVYGLVCLVGWRNCEVCVCSCQ